MPRGMQADSRGQDRAEFDPPGAPPAQRRSPDFAVASTQRNPHTDGNKGGLPTQRTRHPVRRSRPRRPTFWRATKQNEKNVPNRFGEKKRGRKRKEKGVVDLLTRKCSTNAKRESVLLIPLSFSSLPSRFSVVHTRSAVLMSAPSRQTVLRLYRWAVQHARALQRENPVSSVTRHVFGAPGS